MRIDERTTLRVTLFGDIPVGATYKTCITSPACWMKTDGADYNCVDLATGLVAYCDDDVEVVRIPAHIVLGEA